MYIYQIMCVYAYILYVIPLPHNVDYSPHFMYDLDLVAHF
jgi:hypothetical protein